METLQQPVHLSDQSLFELQIDQENTSYLSEMARWGKFLSIVGFVLTGLVTLGLLVQAFSADTYASLYTPLWQKAIVPMLLIAVIIIYFFPCLYLFNFSSKMKFALRSDDQEYMLIAFKNLKACFKFVGICTLVMISLNLIIWIFLIVSAATH
jgi:hypothetical protein